MLINLSFEKKHWAAGRSFIAGIDEAGRGPLAGPVVAAAVIFSQKLKIFPVNDSKKLTPAQRDIIYQKIMDNALAVGIGSSDEKIVDQINILQATYRAMRLAVNSLKIKPDYVVVDGHKIPELQIPQTAICKGDQQCYSIAAASIVAKVTRDRLMQQYDKQYPQYFFAQHKGYPTEKHIRAISEYGLCPIHRISFKINTVKNNEQL